MGATTRLFNPPDGNGDDGVPIAPMNDARDTDATLYTSGMDIAGDDSAPVDSKNILRPVADGTFDSESDKRDVRPNQVQVITLSSFGGVDEFTLTVNMTGEGLGIETTMAFTRGTDAAASDLQTELRTVTGDTGLTVTGTTDAGPYTITHTKATWTRQFPRYTVNGTGCTGVVTFDADPEGAATIGLLGESHRVSESDTILKPTIGTITISANTTDEVDTYTYSAGTDGGTVEFHYLGRATGGLAWDGYVSEWQDGVDNAFSAAGFAADSPTVVISSGAEEATIDLGDIGAADTFKLTYDAVESTDLITYAATLTTEIQAAVDELLGGADRALVAKVDSNTYTVTKLNAGAFATTFTVTTVTGFTPEGGGGYTDGGQITSAAADLVWQFTFSNGDLAGMTVGGDFGVYSDLMTDGGVSEPGAYANVTPAVLGSISAAYTENGGGDAVIGAAVHDTTGKSYTQVAGSGLNGIAGVDAATPFVVTGLPAGAYHLILRTVEDGRVSKADSKAFTIS